MRETQSLTTSGGHIATLNTYLTAREIGSVSDKKELTDSQKTQYLLSLAVVQLDGSSENLLDRLLDLPAKDYLELVQEVTATITPTAPGSAAQPGSGTSEPAV